MAKTTKRIRRGPHTLKLRPELADRLVEALRAGATLKAAAAYCEIDEATVRNWMRWGRNDGEGVYHDLFLRLSTSRAIPQVACAAAVYSASKQDWRAAAWFLEHGYDRDSWRAPVHIDVNLADLSDEEIIEALDRVAVQLAERGIRTRRVDHVDEGGGD